MIRKFSGMILALALSVAPAVAAPQVVTFLSDLEGSARKLTDFLDHSPSFHKTGAGWSLAADAIFVVGGDNFDRFVGDLAIARTLETLRLSAKDRVLLTAGNRDLNKLRLRPELSKKAMRKAPAEKAEKWQPWLEAWIVKAGWRTSAADIDAADLAKANTPANRLRFILAETMGAPDAFEFRRRELGQGTSDEAVVASFVDETRRDGSIYRILKASRLMWRVGNTLFMHGGVTDANIGVVPDKAPAAANVEEWIRRLDAWYLREFAAWDAAADEWDGTGERPGEGLIRYAEPAAGKPINPESVVYNRNVDQAGKIALPGEKAIRFLRASGIDRLAIGHTPSGQVPVVLRTSDDAFEQIIVDNSRGLDPEAASVVNFSGEPLTGTEVTSFLTTEGSADRQAVHFRVDLRSPTRIGKCEPDGAIIIAPVSDGFVTYQLEPGFKVKYRTSK
jgi:hypothetical protein